MRQPSQAHLSRRERQIMDVLYRQGEATTAEVKEQIADPPSYSAVRAMLKVLENKGHLRHEMEGTKFVYLPSEVARVRGMTIERVELPAQPMEWNVAQILETPTDLTIVEAKASDLQ